MFAGAMQQLQINIQLIIRTKTINVDLVNMKF